MKSHPDKSTVIDLKPPTNQSELQQNIHHKFTDRYGADAENITDKIINHFLSEQFDWDTIVHDLQCENIIDCEGMSQIIQTELNLDSPDKQQEAFELYKSCLLPFDIKKSSQHNQCLSNISNMEDVQIRLKQVVSIQLQCNTKSLEKDIQLLNNLDEIRKDINKDPNDSTLCKTVKSFDKSNRFKVEDIHKMLKHALFPQQIHIAPTENRLMMYSNINNKHIERANILLSTYCAAIFNTEYKNNDEIPSDQTYKTIKAIDIINEKPILLFFMDSYSRLRMKKYFTEKYTKNTQDKDNIYINKWDLNHFCSDNKKTIEKLLFHSTDNIHNIKNKFISINGLQNGLKSFGKRLNMKMKLSQHVRLVCDNLHDYSVYLWGINEYMTNRVEIDFIPSHIDFIIIPQCVKGININDIDIKDQSYYDQEDDSDDDKQQETDEEMDFLWMGFGGTDSGKVFKKPVYEINDIEMYLNECNYKKDKDYIVDEISYFDRDSDKKFNEQFNDITIKRTLKKMHTQILKNNKMNSSHQRLIFIIDRRNPKIFDPENVNRMSYSLYNKNWNDKIYCIKPKQYFNIPKPYYFLPECLFCLSQQLLLPSNKKYKNKIIGIRESLNGYLFVLSYHIYSLNSIRAYFGYNGQMQRFYMNDVVWFWPSLFVNGNENMPQKVNDKFKHYAKINYIDRDFDAFYKSFK